MTSASRCSFNTSDHADKDLHSFCRRERFFFPLFVIFQFSFTLLNSAVVMDNFYLTSPTPSRYLLLHLSFSRGCFVVLSFGSFFQPFSSRKFNVATTEYKTQLAIHKYANGVSTGTTLFCSNRPLTTLLMILRSLWVRFCLICISIAWLE